MLNEGHADYIASYLAESADAVARFAASAPAKQCLAQMASVIASSLQAGGKLMVAGNGGSAADAQHIAGEFVVRLMYDRAPLAAIALTTDGSVMTASGNDYGYEHVFERQVLALGRPGDVFLGISTSGHSMNIVRALDVARNMKMTTLGFTGGDGGKMPDLCDHVLVAPSAETGIIQQLHITAAHVVCAVVERTMFPRPA
jgi:D-sedoheptulose 7-phosphate isomerase